MRVIAVEEHYLDPGIGRATAPAMMELSPDFMAAFASAGDFPSPEKAQDLGEGRLAAMDAAGISMQVLSTPGAQLLPADSAVAVAGAVNDKLATAVRAHPDRFAALATVPTAAPDAGAGELSRCIGELGFVGALITGRTEGEFLDAPRCEPLLARAAELGVPLYLHPAVPPRAVTDACYADGLAPFVTARLQTSGWGWHQDTAVHFLRLVLSGALDRHPRLQLILGHWGELIPFFLDRIAEELPRRVTGLDREFDEYFRDNVHISPSGMFSQAHLRFCLELMPIERILFSVDYPIEPHGSPTEFLEQADLSDEHKHLLAHGNAERLFGLAPDRQPVN